MVTATNPNKLTGKRAAWTFGVLAVLWVGFIFWNSLHNGTDSQESSNWILLWLKKMPIFTWMNSFLIRKAAHLTEFAILGFLMAGSAPARMTRPLFCVLLTAVCDETIQLFVEGRTSSVRDVWIDFAGALIGVLVCRMLVQRDFSTPKKIKFDRNRVILLILLGCCVAFIWGQSLQNGLTSNEISGAVVDGVKEATNIHDTGLQSIANFLIRKCAHFTEFFVFGAVVRCLIPAGTAQAVWKRLFIVLLMPCSDEGLQLIVSGRTSMVRDVWIDFCGAVVGMIAITAVHHLWMRRNETK